MFLNGNESRDIYNAMPNTSTSIEHCLACITTVSIPPLTAFETVHHGIAHMITFLFNERSNPLSHHSFSGAPHSVRSCILRSVARWAWKVAVRSASMIWCVLRTYTHKRGPLDPGGCLPSLHCGSADIIQPPPPPSDPNQQLDCWIRGSSTRGTSFHAPWFPNTGGYWWIPRRPLKRPLVPRCDRNGQFNYWIRGSSTPG